MMLLDNERQLEFRNVEGQILGIEDPQHVDLLCHRLNAPLQLAHTLLLTRILLHHML